MPADTANLVRAFAAQHGREPRFIAEAPGRVNLIGEHTDYNGGFVLPVAIDRTIAVAVAPREDNRVLAHSVDHDQRDDFSLDGTRRHPMGGWRNYVRGVLWALLDSQLPLRGVDLSISGDIPQGAGLSSSAALELALAGAICAASGVELPPREMALLCQRAEHMYAGVQCGIMDQFAAALAREGSALFIDCQSIETEDIPLPDGIAIVVIDSKVPRDLAGTPYNRRRDECAEAARALNVPRSAAPSYHRSSRCRTSCGAALNTSFLKTRASSLRSRLCGTATARHSAVSSPNRTRAYGTTSKPLRRRSTCSWSWPTPRQVRSARDLRAEASAAAP
jgi:galactokinase